MDIRIKIMKLILVLISASTVLAEHSVLLNNGFQKITSSTLKWLPQNDQAALRDAVVGSVEYLPIGKFLILVLSVGGFFHSKIYLKGKTLSWAWC